MYGGPTRRLLHALHRLEYGRLGVEGGCGDHFGIDLTEREPRPTAAHGKRRQGRRDLVATASGGQLSAPKPGPAGAYTETAVRIWRHHLHRRIATNCFRQLFTARGLL